MDFHARAYDPQIGRFLGVDPLADDGGQEIYSPYAAMGNMPESCIDPDGMQYQMMNKNLFDVVQASGGRQEYGTFIDGGAPQQVANGTWGEWSMGGSFAVYQSCFVARQDDAVSATTGDKTNIDLGVAACNHTATAVGSGSVIVGDPVPGTYEDYVKNEKNGLISNVIDGFKGGLQSTWNGIKSQFTVDGYINTLINSATLGGYAIYNQMNAVTEVVQNIPNYTAADYQYGTGYVLEKGVEILVMKKVGEAASFKLNDGWGLFGEKGLNVRGNTVNVLYRDRQGGGTFFSLKQHVNGGNLLRWDKGVVEGGSGQSSIHSHFRFNIRGNTYGSTAQYPWYAPFQFWKYKK